ncbi:hypothetical protein JTB14_019987 [Gonioctena quinquepunctata]|nr:hypothetical protein JTB14_019987 [Gonioctena quinquepunctata]
MYSEKMKGKSTSFPHYLLLVVSALLFFYGFFPVSRTNEKLANDPPTHINSVNLNKQVHYTSQLSKFVLIIIDALRYDFVSPELMPLTSKLFQSNGCMNRVRVEAPTVTLPRIKAMMAGNIPQFIDMVLNLASTEVLKDSLIHSAYKKGKSILFYGDDTWLKLFPNYFTRYEGIHSFFVRDFSLDDNVTRNVDIELRNVDWDIMILHYLGLDHIGHVYGPSSPLIPGKLKEMDEVIYRIYKNISAANDTLIVVTGDHGMRDSGGHGGSSYSETNVPFLVIGLQCDDSYFPQTDIPVNLAVLLGLDIPSSTIGKIQRSLLTFTLEKYLYVLRYNALLLQQKSCVCDDQFEQATILHEEYLKNFDERAGFRATELYDNCSETIRNNMIKLSVEQNFSSLNWLTFLYYSLIYISTITMNAVRSARSTTIYEHTPQVFHRRRSLFPAESSDSESDSDLGHMSPISFDSCFGPDDLQYCFSKQSKVDNPSVSKPGTVGDYNILGIVEDELRKSCTPTSEKFPALETMSPLYLSPHIGRNKADLESYVDETPSKISPTNKLKTPHDTSNTNTKLPKLVRKSLLDSSEIPSNKRKLSPYNSPKQTKHIKLDPKNSKVRTTLFPEVNISLPTKQFYPKAKDILEKVTSKKETSPKPSVTFNTSRKTRTRKNIGQINAGVRHKIRKPKPKKASRTSLAKAALNSADNTAITEYIMDLKEMKSKTKTGPLIENKENTEPVVSQQKPIIPATVVSQQKQIIPATEQKLTAPVTFSEKLLSQPDSKKRTMSPEPETDGSRKFFKFTRSKGVLKMNENIKLQVGDGKVTIIEKSKKNRFKADLDMRDLLDDELDIPKTDIDSVISSLEEEPCPPVQENPNKITLQAHSSVVASDNSILLHQRPARCPASIILSPISQMCDDTSGLALSSPKMAKNLMSVLDRMPNATQNIFNKSGPQKKNELFPIFYGSKENILDKKVNKSTCSDKKFKKLPPTQMLLDAGQKRFGVTQCPECEIVYHMGDPSEEIMHLHYHNSVHILRFYGWKNERVVANFHNNGRIIQIVPNDPKAWWKKANDLMNLINQELGCYNMEFSLDNCQVFLYIKKKSIVGCLVAIAKEEGHQMLCTRENEPELCSESKYPIKCGIPRIWVAHNHRKHGIGTAMMNALKHNFILGYALKNSDVAFSSPTEMGQKFASSYCKTPNYLIYF